MQTQISINLLQNALQELYSGSNHSSPLKLKQAEEYLVYVQKSDNAHLIALELLDSAHNVRPPLTDSLTQLTLYYFFFTAQEPNLIFFAAQTLYKCLHRDWQHLEMPIKQRIGSTLVKYIYASVATIPHFVLTKLVLAFSVFTIKFTDHEPDSIPKFCSNTILVCDDPAKKFAFLKIIVQFLTFVPEESCKMQFAYSDGITVRFRISTFSTFALDNVIPLLRESDPSVKVAALNCVSSWSMNSTIDTTSFFRVFEEIIPFLSDLECLESAVDLIMNLLADSRISGKEKTVALQLYPILINMKSTLHEAIAEETEEFVLPFCKLICKFAETFVGFLIESLPSSMPFFEIIFACLSYPAIYPSNPDISEIPHFVIFTLEGELDSGNGLQTSTAKYGKDIISHSHEIMIQALAILVDQTRYPPDSVVKTWTRDYLDRFRQHRRECADTSLYCYYALNERALHHVVNGISMEMQQLSVDPARGLQMLESMLFHFRAFSESISSDETEFVPLIFQESTFQAFLQICHTNQDGSKILRSTMSSTIGSYADWLSNNPSQALPVCVRFLASELTASESPRIPSAALVEVSLTCSAALAPNCDQVLNLCVAALNSCSPEIKSQIFQSMAYIVKALPPDEASPRLVFLLNGILDELIGYLIKCEQV